MRDLKADLELCEKASPGPWRDERMIAESREGWPDYRNEN